MNGITVNEIIKEGKEKISNIHKIPEYIPITVKKDTAPLIFIEDTGNMEFRKDVIDKVHKDCNTYYNVSNNFYRMTIENCVEIEQMVEYFGIAKIARLCFEAGIEAAVHVQQEQNKWMIHDIHNPSL